MFSWAIFLLSVSLVNCATRITFPGCDRAGWKCNKVQASPIRYELEYVCQNTAGIIFSLWNFNAPTEIKYLKIVNCSAVEVDLTCTNVGRQIESLHVKNIGVFNFTNLLYSDTAQMPERVIVESVQEMFIPQKTFKQMKHPVASVYRCAVNTFPLNRVNFNNVNIKTIEQNAFFNLTEMKEFVWSNVSVDTMEPLALQVNMDKEGSFIVFNSKFNKLDYKAFDIRSHNIVFNQSKFQELPRNVIDSTSFNFNFINNTVLNVQTFAFMLLSQNITFEFNYFTSLKTSAFQGVGPGLLENAFISFGQLKFTYNFNNNSISHSDIGGLNPDWIAYKNVHSSIHVSGNYLPCSCRELGWITLRAGLGDEFSSMMNFNSKFLDKTNKNLCSNSPCELPVTVMAGMHIKFGVCGTPDPLVNWCKKYRPSQNDYGFGKTTNMVLKQWENELKPQKTSEEVSSFNVDAFEDMFAENYLTHFNGHPKESYFKIEKTGVADSPLHLIENLVNQNPQYVEVPEPETNTSTLYPDIVFKDDDTTRNNTLYKYSMDVKNGTKNETNTNDVGFNTLKKEYEDNQKEFVKKSYEEWQAQRKKRMVYFKVYGNLLTLDE